MAAALLFLLAFSGARSFFVQRGFVAGAARMALRLRGRRLSLLIFSYFISELSSFSFISQKKVVPSLDFIKGGTIN